MKIPTNYSINLRVDGELVKISLHKEFSLKEESLEESPLILGYLVGLQSRVLSALNQARLEKDRYYARQYLILKEDDTYSRIPSDTWVDQEIIDDDGFMELRVNYEKQREYYNLITGLIDTYKTRIEVLRTLAANRRKESQL